MSMSWKIAAVMTSERTYGAKKISRKNARPRKRPLSIRARLSANGIWMTSDSVTKNTLWAIAEWNTGSDRARS